MPDIKSTVIATICIAIIILSLSVGYSLCVRGSAEICFMTAPTELASSTMNVGFEIGGYRIRVSK